MSTRSHDKTVETADNPLYDVLFFLGGGGGGGGGVSLFFVNRFLCVFKRVSTQQYQLGIVCAAGFFFLRDHRRTSPFSNLFKILLNLELNCCYFRIALFLNALFFLFCILISEIPPPSLSLRLKYQFFTRPPMTHTRIFKPCTVLRVHTFQFKYQEHTRHRVAPRLLMKVKSRFNCDIM